MDVAAAAVDITVEITTTIMVAAMAAAATVAAATVAAATVAVATDMITIMAADTFKAVGLVNRAVVAGHRAETKCTRATRIFRQVKVCTPSMWSAMTMLRTVGNLLIGREDAQCTKVLK